MSERPLDDHGTRPRVLLADDHALLLAAFAKLLEHECDIVGTVTDGLAVLPEVLRTRPDIVVLDISMPGIDGLEVGRRLRAQVPDVKFLYLTVNEDPDAMAEALRIGATGFLLKRAAATELFDAIQMAATGETYVTPSPRGQDHGEATGRELAAALTVRQREVLRLIVEGLTMKGIAWQLGITQRTVAFHKYRMMQDLGISTTAQLVSFAMRHGLGDPP